MAGLLTMLNPGLADNPMYQGFDQRRNAITGFGAGLIGGDPREKMQNALLYGMQGRQQDTAYQTELRKQKEQEDQINRTVQYLQQNRPDLAQQVEAGMPVADAWKILNSPAGAGGVDYFGTPIPFRTENGIQYGQLNDAGQFKPIELPEGAAFAPKTTNVDLGNMISVQDQFGNELYRMPKSGSVPTGFEANPQGGGIAPMQGSPQAAEMEASRAKAATSMSRLEQKQQIATQAIDKAISQSNFWTTGLAGSMGAAVPGTPQYDLARTLDTIKANIGFEELQAMRDASPTGGALGQVTERELAFLQSTIVNIEQAQSEQQLRENLSKLREYLGMSAEQRRAAFAQQYGGGQQQPSGGGDVIDWTDL